MERAVLADIYYRCPPHPGGTRGLGKEWIKGKDQMTNRIGNVAAVVLLGVAGFVGYRLIEANLRADIYRDRLTELADNYDQLRQTYNQAVRKTAVTELVVQDGKLCVSIRTAQGVVKQIPTPFDPSGEIYVDYVVLDGRLWVRRVFDAQTPPSAGVLIEPQLAEVGWDDPALAHGKAVYRRLGEGRWLVTVTGDGSLGLARATDDAPTDLTATPPVRDYEPVSEQARAEVDRIGPGDVVRRLVGVR
jgi:hypothetical protein